MYSQVLIVAAALVGGSVAAPDHVVARAATNTALQTNFPQSSGTTNLAAARTLAAGEVLDGGMKQWDRSRRSSFQTSGPPSPSHVSDPY